MIALCYEQTPKRSMFPFAIMLQILKNRYISFDCEMSLVIACQIYLLNETWLHSQSGIIFANEDSRFHSLSHNIIWLQKTWNSTLCICNASILCFGHFLQYITVSVHLSTCYMCYIAHTVPVKCLETLQFLYFLMKSHQVWIYVLKNNETFLKQKH